SRRQALGVSRAFRRWRTTTTRTPSERWISARREGRARPPHKLHVSRRRSRGLWAGRAHRARLPPRLVDLACGLAIVRNGVAHGHASRSGGSRVSPFRDGLVRARPALLSRRLAVLPRSARGVGARRGEEGASLPSGAGRVAERDSCDRSRDRGSRRRAWRRSDRKARARARVRRAHLRALRIPASPAWL